MPRSSRRGFLASALAPCVAIAATSRLFAGQRGLDQFLVAAPPCKDDLTPAVPAGREFRAGAPVRASLIEAGASGTRMTLSGFVTGLACGRISSARIDFWHADAAGALDMTGFKFRGAVTTDAEGKYKIDTIVPGAAAGRARRIGARVRPPGKPAFTTYLFFPDDAAAAKDAAYKPLLVLKQTGVGNPRTYTFDFLLDL
jgi:protocatechuate 3,4-dioxygenase beta subunit